GVAGCVPGRRDVRGAYLGRARTDVPTFAGARGPRVRPRRDVGGPWSLRRRLGDGQSGELRRDLGAIVLVLHEGPQGRLGGGVVERARAEEDQGARPVDRLGDRRRLLEIERPYLAREGRELRREARPDPRDPELEDRLLARGRRVVDEGVQTPPPQRVAHVARPVAREDEERRALRA